MKTTKLTHITGCCLITGASHGIGKAFAHEWASKGVSILAISIDTDALAILKEEVESIYKVSCHTLVKDLLEPNASNEVYDWCTENNINIQDG